MIDSKASPEDNQQYPSEKYKNLCAVNPIPPIVTNDTPQTPPTNHQTLQLINPTEDPLAWYDIYPYL